jgi:hypothetical protein
MRIDAPGAGRRRVRGTAWTIAFATVGFLAACGEPGTRSRGPCTGQPEGLFCRADRAFVCDAAGVVASERNCSAEGLSCFPELGCAACEPARASCDGNTFRRCNGDGSDFDQVLECGEGEFCGPSGCADLCAQAAATSSYQGCEYFAVPTINVAELFDSPFSFAVVVANTQLVPAEVRVTHAHLLPAPVERTVPPGEIAAIRLPYVPELFGGTLAEDDGGGDGGPPDDGSSPVSWGTERVPGAAYRVTASVPVTVYQFNPLEFQQRGSFSFTNDASLLLPTHTLTERYLGTARPTQHLVRRFLEDDDRTTEVRSFFPGFLAVVATAPGETDVTVRASAFIAPSRDDGQTFPALAPGEETTVTLEQGDVLQVLSSAPADCPAGYQEERSPDLPANEEIRYCDLGRDYDLTGTRIEGTAPLAVIGGHQCTFVPFDRWACDHLEESLFPVEAWGREILVAAPESIRGEPFLARVISATDGNRLRSNPPGVGLDVVLDEGEFVEIEARADFIVEADGPAMVAQFLVGQDWAGWGASAADGATPVGDPSMSVAIPREQLRASYGFLAPATFTETWVTLLAPAEATVSLDGAVVDLSDGSPVGDSDLRGSRLQVAAGAHRIESDQLVGLVVHGYASYTSFMLPGGLDFVDLGLLR